MAKIEEIKTTEEGKIIICLDANKKELSSLKGNLDKIHLFSEYNLEEESRLLKRGRRESTKYFLLPKKLRDGVIPSNDVNCTRIDTKNSHLFIFSVPKNN